MSSLDDVGPAAIELSESYIYGLTNAVVYPPGIVTVNGKVLKETLAHIPFGQLGYARSEHTVELPDAASHTDLPEAFHLLGGNNQNYFHWMLDILPRLQVEPFANRRFAGPILVPSMRTTFQRDSLALLLTQPNPVISVTDHEAVRVGTLHFIPNLVGYGFAPSPNLNAFFDILKQRLTARSGLARRIYVSRKDSGNRRLINEDAVISLVSKYGFEVVELSRLTLSEQASVFASATQIVAPHGAGLANLVFCGPGAVLCELQMNEYMQCFFRRLAGTRGMRYGCLIGQAEPSEPGMWVHAKRWSAPIDRLRAVLDDPGFSGTSNASTTGIPYAGHSLGAPAGSAWHEFQSRNTHNDRSLPGASIASVSPSSEVQVLDHTKDGCCGEGGERMTDIRRMLAQLGLANPYAGIDVQQLHLDMQGWGSDHHYFSTLVSQARPGLIIEVGTWKGASAITMARHALTTCQDVTVLCVDTWSGSSEHWTDNGYRMLLNLQHGYPALYRQFLANVILNGLTTTVFPLPMTSTAAAELLAGFQVQAELIYIDAGHSEYEVYGDLSQYWALLRPGGVLFGDDYSLAWRGVVAAVNRFVAEHRLPLEVDQGKWAIAKPI